MIHKKTILACVFLHALLCLAIDYNDLQALGVRCHGRDSCSNLSKNFHDRNCECDRLCVTFGDCCVDAPWRRPFYNEMLRCVPFGKTPHVGIYAISNCPKSDDPLADHCLSEDLSDPLLAAPVSTPGGATYSNVYCAACNKADLESLVIWKVLVNCQTLAPHNLSSQFVWQSLEQDDSGEWGVNFRDQFHECEVIFDKPDSIKNERLCRADVISSCTDIEEFCDSYTAVVYTTEDAYLNPHCALCNGESVDQLYCDLKGLISPKLRNFSFALLFDVNRKDGDCVGASECGTCPEGETYDPFFKKCRQPFCAIPGYKMVDNKCVKE